MFDKLPRNRVYADVPGEGHRPLDWVPSGLEPGMDRIADAVLSACHAGREDILYVALDATHGANVQAVASRLTDRLEQEQIRAHVYSTEDYLYGGSELRRRFDRYITDNRAFGYMASDVSFTDYFRPDAAVCWAAEAKQDTAAAPQAKQVVLLCGPGALWLGGDRIGLSFYCDVSREYQQREHRQSLRNLGFSWNRDHTEKYKICLFLEWPAWEAYRKQHLGRFDYYVDLNRSAKPVITTTAALRRMLAEAARQPFRVKPFFAPGVWGGQFLKELCDLPPEWVNCAWSFEPIAPENTLLLEYRDETIEVPFTVLLGYEHQAVMGERIVGLFGDYFPVRFDYLDTMDGSHLSCQVHPKQEYVEDVFNERMTQQESYYIMERRDDAKVYVGLTDGTTPDRFLDAVREAQDTGVPLPFESYVKEYDSAKGALYLIPPGTVHCSGKDNLVLEISSTTWWFTFKIYDYLRQDLDGKPRPINIDHAAQNINAGLSEDLVKQRLIPAPQLIGRQGVNEEYLLGEHEEVLFSVKRVHLIDRWEDDTNGEFVMVNLVEGERVRLVPLADESKAVEFGYAESYIVPAGVGAYRLENVGGAPCKLVKAGVASHWQTPLLPHNWPAGAEA